MEHLPTHHINNQTNKRFNFEGVGFKYPPKKLQDFPDLNINDVPGQPDCFGRRQE